MALGDGDGTFTEIEPPVDIACCFRDWQIAAPDLFDDGLADLILVSPDMFSRSLAATNLSGRPALSVADLEVREGSASTSTALFRITRTGPTTGTTQVDYRTVDGTADAADYVARSGRLRFGPGVTSQTVAVTVRRDGIPEPTFTGDVPGSTSP